METPSHTRSPGGQWGTIVGWALVAAVGGLACVVVPAYLFPPAKIEPEYGHPLIPWFARAFANLNFVGTLVSMSALGFVLGFAQPRWWWVSCCLTALLPIVLNAVNLVHDLDVDPGSHNLFPFEFAFLIFLSSPAVVFGLVGCVVRKVVRRRTA